MDEPTDPLRCSKHQNDPDPPPCGGCGRARTTHEAAVQAAQIRGDRDQRLQEQLAARQAALDRASTDPDARTRTARANAARARAELRRPARSHADQEAQPA